MTTINPTYILIAKPYVAAAMRARAISQGRDISDAQVTAEQTAVIVQREVGHYLQLALAAAQIPGVTPAAGSVYAMALGMAGMAPTASENAAEVWSALAAQNNTAGSMGELLNSAAADPLLGSVEGGLTLRAALRILLAGMAGSSERAGNTITFTSPVDGSTVRITGSFDAENNRTGVILDGD